MCKIFCAKLEVFQHLTIFAFHRFTGDGSLLAEFLHIEDRQAAMREFTKKTGRTRRYDRESIKGA